MIGWIFSSCVLILIVLFIRQVFKNKVSACFRYGLWLLVAVRLLIPFSLPGTGISVLNMVQMADNALLEFEITNVSGESLAYVNRTDTGNEHPVVEQDNPTTQNIVSVENKENTIEQMEGIHTAENVISQGILSEENQQLIADYETPDFVLKDTFPDNGNTKTQNSFFGKIIYNVWLVGAGICAIVILTSNVAFSKKLKKTRFKVGGEITWISQLPVYQSKIISTPCMFGILKPAIYLNTEHLGEGLSYVLKHENTHYRHKDHIWAFFRSICLILHWYNPLVWLSVYLSMKDAEFACDESVIKNYSEDAKKEYGKTLIALTVKHTPSLTLLSCASTLSGGKGYTKERIKRIVKSSKTLIFPAVLVVFLCVIAVIITFTGKHKENNDTNADRSNNAPSVNQEPLDTQMSVDNDTSSIKPDVSAENQYENNGIAIFLNDHLVDMNGDGIMDVIRINAIAEAEEYRAIELDTEEALANWLENAAYYYEIVLYDGSKLSIDEETFEKGMSLNDDAIVSSGDSRIFATNIDTGEKKYEPHHKLQLSYYEEEEKLYLVSSFVEMVEGVGYYNYMVMGCTEDWESEVIDHDTLTFVVNTKYDPINNFGFKNFSEFAYTYFNYNEMLSYTLHLEEYMKHANLLIDTVNEVSKTPIWYNETVDSPNVYDIWNWNPALKGVTTYDEFKPLFLEYSESVWNSFAGEGFVKYEALEYRGWPVWGMDVSFYYLNAPEVTNPAYSYADIPEEYWNKLPDNAKNLSADIVEFVCEDKAVSEESIWSDWRITELEWVGTYYLDEVPLDVYSYEYLYKLDETSDRDEEIKDTLLWWEEQEDGWFTYDYEKDYVVYDHSQDICFYKGTNDCYPGDNTYTSDLIIYYKNNFLDGFSYTDPENSEKAGE